MTGWEDPDPDDLAFIDHDCPHCGIAPPPRRIPSKGGMWRVKYYRPGWAGGYDAARIRYFSRGYHARLFANKLADGYPTDAGHAIVELSRAPMGRWEQVAR